MMAASINRKGELVPLLKESFLRNDITRTLVVEAIPHRLLEVSACLKNFGILTFDFARSIDSAHHLLKTEFYDLILIDYRMPDGRGLNLLDWIGNYSEVIMLGEASDQRRVECASVSGASASASIIA